MAPGLQWHLMVTRRRNTPTASGTGYRANRAYTIGVYQLGGGLAALSVFQMLPALAQGGFSSAPAWARWLIVISVLQLAYFVWMALAPDWSTVWVAAMVCAVTATLYAALLAIAIFTPATQPLLLELEKLRRQARLWSGAMFLLWLLATYLSGRISSSWWRRFLEGRPV